MKYLAMILFVIMLFAIVIAWQVYAFKDCKRVGHSTMYCIGRIGR